MTAVGGDGEGRLRRRRWGRGLSRDMRKSQYWGLGGGEGQAQGVGEGRG